MNPCVWNIAPPSSQANIFFSPYVPLESPACPYLANVGINRHVMACISSKRIGSVDIVHTEMYRVFNLKVGR